jgi:excisionase family DNA binding protein
MKDVLKEDGNDYITKTEIAARLKVTSRTIDSWMAKGLVPFRKVGRTVRFDWVEVREYLKARSRRPAVETPLRTAGQGIAKSLRERAKEIRRQCC